MAAFVVASVAASAQVYVGGSLGFESSKEYKDAETATLGFVISLLAYEIGLAAQRKWKKAILNPLLISILLFQQLL